MFGHAYFGASYFGDHYFGSAEAEESTILGGDDAYHIKAYHGKKHVGWNKKKWLDEQDKDRSISEIMRRVYYGEPLTDPIIESAKVEAVQQAAIRHISAIFPPLPKIEKIDVAALEVQFKHAVKMYQEAVENDDEEAILLLM
jgi:hypothetical protein